MRPTPRLALVLLLAPLAAAAQTVTPNETTVRAGGQMSVDWTAPMGHSALDWVSVYAPGDANTSYGQYATPAFTSTGAPLSGTMVFDVFRSTAPGTYEYRYLLDNGYVDAATSAPVTVLDACDGTTVDLQATPPVAQAGEDVELTWTLTGGDPALCAQATDWVAMWAVGAPDVLTGYGGTSPTFYYTADQVTGSETFTVNSGTAPGDYEFRYISSGASSSSAASNAVTVLEPCGTSTYDLAVTPTVVEPDGSVTVDWTVTTSNPGACALVTDWIAFFAEGAGNTSYGGTSPLFVYTNGLLTGQAAFTLTGPPTGSYEFRYMRAGYVPAAVSETVVVTDPPAVPALGPWALGAAVLALLGTGWRRLAKRV